jgi:hypothetical protein
MPKVEITVSSVAMAAFVVKRQFDYGDEDWADMDREQRQEMINEDGEAFMREVVEWDYKVL